MNLRSAYLALLVCLLACSLTGCVGAGRAQIPDEHSVRYTLVNAREEGVVLFVETESGDCRCALVHVDGFNNSLDEARSNFAAISRAYQRSGGMCRLFGFAWKSDVGLLSLRRAEREVDERTGSALAAALDRIESRCSAHSLQVTSHSLGARVVLRALAERVQSGRPPVAVAALAASAVPTAQLAPGGELSIGLRGARRVAILGNSQDYILGVFYPMFAGGHPPLGQFGLRHHAPAVHQDLRQHNVELFDLDLARLWGSRHSAVASFDERFWALFLQHIAPRRAILPPRTHWTRFVSDADFSGAWTHQ